MRILHITFFRSHNCGAVLQAWALNRVLEGLGHNVAMMRTSVEERLFSRRRPLPQKDCGILRYVKHLLGWAIVEVCAWRVVRLRNKRAEAFARMFIPSCGLILDQVAKSVDVAVIGSDQVWNAELTQECAQFFNGACLQGRIPKIGYGVSIGDRLPNVQWRRELESVISEYLDISVRELFLADYVESVVGCRPKLVLDPTLLLTKDAYAEVAYPEKLVKGRYLYVYELHYEPFIHEFAERFATERGIKVVYSAVYHHGHFGGVPKEIDLATSPDRFLAYIRDAEYVLASSFHGTLFALMYSKKVLTMRSKPEIGESRIGRLFENFGLERRLFVCGDDYREGADILDRELPIDFQDRIVPLRDQSVQYLDEALRKVSQ